MKKIYIFYNMESSPSMGEDFFNEYHNNEDFKIYYFEKNQEIIMSKAYEEFIEDGLFNVIALDEKNNVIGAKNYSYRLVCLPSRFYTSIKKLLELNA